MFYANYENANVLNATHRNPHPTYTTSNLGNVGHNAYNVFEIRRNSTTNGIFSLNNSIVATIATNVPTISLNIYMFAQGHDVYCDWVFMANNTTNEPTWGSFGAEETPSETGWANIAKVIGTASADIAKVCGIAVAGIANINGVAV